MNDSIKRVLRTFLVSFVGIAVPGSLSWLNALTDWARAEGQAPFPDARSLAFVGVAAIVAGIIAALNLLLISVEDFTGKGVLRDVPPKAPRNEQGAVSVKFAVQMALLWLVWFTAVAVVVVAIVAG